VTSGPTEAARTTIAAEQTLHAVLSGASRPSRPSAFSAAATFGWRGMLKIKHVPEQLIDVTLTPLLFTVLFTYMYGGAISGSTEEYLQFILPGILAMAVLFTTVYSGVALNTDMTKGVVDRFRSLPIWRPAPLAGAVLGDCLRFFAAGAVVVLLAVILGYRPDGGVLGLFAAILLVVAFAFGLSWVFTTVGLLMRAPNAVMNAGFMALFPLTFVSNAFVPPETLPGWLEAIVDANPISQLVSAARGLAGGAASGSEIAIVLGTAAGLTLVFAPLTALLYRRGRG
jgi:ABC-2 type transport system permease protein